MHEKLNFSVKCHTTFRHSSVKRLLVKWSEYGISNYGDPCTNCCGLSFFDCWHNVLLLWWSKEREAGLKTIFSSPSIIIIIHHGYFIINLHHCHHSTYNCIHLQIKTETKANRSWKAEIQTVIFGNRMIFEHDHIELDWQNKVPNLMLVLIPFWLIHNIELPRIRFYFWLKESFTSCWWSQRWWSRPCCWGWSSWGSCSCLHPDQWRCMCWCLCLL